MSIRSDLTRDLRSVGLTRSAIDAVWPEWWSQEAETSPSASAELRYTMARRLGLSPRSLFDGPPRFVWHENAKFKNLGATSLREQEILTSFGTAVGIALIEATEATTATYNFSPLALREAALSRNKFVGLADMIETYWVLAIPVIKPRVSPLQQKRMQAMSVGVRGRFAVLVTRNTRSPAWLAFILAHELGHIVLGHVGTGAALLEMKDPLQLNNRDEEEQAADEFALTLLMGNSRFEVGSAEFNSTQLAHACLERSESLRVDPGLMALSIGHATGRWPQALGALKIIPGQQLPTDIGDVLNRVALDQLRTDSLAEDKVRYLHALIGHPDGH